MSASATNPFDDSNLEFQDFSHTRSGAPRDSLGDMSPAIGADAFSSSDFGNGIGIGGGGGGGGIDGSNVDGGSLAHPEQASAFSFWHVRYYAAWFNVDTADVAARIAFSSVPLSDKFFDKLNRNPDLYGPLWISSTVVFMLAATGNFAEWLTAASQRGMAAALAGGHSLTYDFTKVTFGATIVYGYASLVPLLVFFALRYAGARTSLVDLLCLYGYSLFIYVPASILCIPPSSVVQWIFVALAAAASTTFVVRSLRYAMLRDQCDQRIASAVIAAAALLSVAFAVTLKLFLFQNADLAALIPFPDAANTTAAATATALTATAADSANATDAAAATAALTAALSAAVNGTT